MVSPPVNDFMDLHGHCGKAHVCKMCFGMQHLEKWPPAPGSPHEEGIALHLCSTVDLLKTSSLAAAVQFFRPTC